MALELLAQAGAAASSRSSSSSAEGARAPPLRARNARLRASAHRTVHLVCAGAAGVRIARVASASAEREGALLGGSIRFFKWTDRIATNIPMCCARGEQCNMRARERRARPQTPIPACDLATHFPGHHGSREGSGWDERLKGGSRQGEGGRRPSWARSNGNRPYLTACRMHGGAGAASVEVEVEKLPFRRHGERARGRWSAEGCKTRRGWVGVIKGAFGRRSAVDVRMRWERARTVRSFK